MEQSKKFANKLNNFEKAVNQLKDSLGINLVGIGLIERDTIMNGQIQKFEVCTELLWKTIQAFLREKHGVDSVSPKTSSKEFFKLKYMDEKSYETVLQMIEDRNRLSHIYNDIFFQEIHSHLESYLLVFNNILDSLKN